MTPKIVECREKKLVGMHLSLSLANYTIGELWQAFMPRRKEINNNLTSDLISLAVYRSDHFENFLPTNPFVRWATVEVSDFDHVPRGMETLVLPSGLYAVFHYVGRHTDNSIFQYIFGTWLPSSDYIVDNRPHFEVLGSKYRNNDPNSEEEIWIPIKPRYLDSNVGSLSQSDS
jgi:AraC family transcriptional regulator